MSIARIAIVLALTLSTSAALGEDGWAEYHAEDYGFAMLVPAGAEIEEREWKGGWAGIAGSYQGVELYGLTLAGEKAGPAAIERIGVELTGIAAEHWTVIDEGEDSAGWEWYRTVEAEGESRVVFGGYGVGPAGSYLLILITTADDFELYAADYQEWYESVRLD